jgi:2OG-Fe(II) oxygenase superfamily
MPPRTGFTHAAACSFSGPRHRSGGTSLSTRIRFRGRRKTADLPRLGLAVAAISVRSVRGEKTGRLVRLPLRLRAPETSGSGADSAWLTSVARSVETFADLPAGSVRQILCTEYDVGVGIGWHRDKPHFDKVFGLSLGAPCKFRFRRAAGDKWQRFTLTAEPRSLYMLSGESRQIWEHSIPAVEQRRYSITFRTARAEGI